MQSLFPQIDGTQVSISTATRSSGGGSPNNIVDGNTGTDDAQLNGNYWEMDLGSIKNICKVRLYPTSGWYSIRLSTTGAFAGEEYYALTADGGGSDFAGFPINYSQWNDYYINPLVSARYVRIYTESNATLNEVEVYETTESVFGILTSDSSLYDGPIDTVEEAHRRRWISKDTTSPNPALSSTEYAQLDLESTKTIEQIDNYVANLCQYSIKISTTGVFGGEEITVVNDLVRASGQYNDTTNLPADARYIRVIATSNTKLTELDILWEPATEEIKDIDNDFRMIPTTLIDISNDIRTKGQEELYDTNNDFRMQGAVLDDVLNDFRMNYNLILKDITSDFRFVKEVDDNILNKISVVAPIPNYNINNDIRFLNRTISDVFNTVTFKDAKVYDLDNDIRTKKLEINDVKNDIRILADFNTPGNAGFQSLGKEYIKVYINSVEQTDVDIDTITITKNRSNAHTAIFDLGRAYDATKPNMELPVEIKYHIWTLYKGYIVSVSPADTPEAIRISCADKYWKDNRAKKYFFVGHKPRDNKEKYYNTIQEALSTELSWNLDIGDFIPQNISCFAEETSDCVTSLIQSSGNYDWYYDVEENRKLIIDGSGQIVKLNRQEIGKNLGLYDITRHQFTENVESIINKLRVQMGEEIAKQFNDSGGVKTYTGYNYNYYKAYATPTWEYSKQKLAKNSPDGFGLGHHAPNQSHLYQDVFKVYNLPSLDKDIASWSDRWPPSVEIFKPDWWTPIFPWEVLKEGFTIDFENGLLIFDEPYYFYRVDDKGQISEVGAPNIYVKIGRKNHYSYTISPTEDPETDISNELMFFVGPIGDYYDDTSTVILGFLDLPGLSKQAGGTFINAKRETEVIPTWDDTEFATDYANWQLSKSCNTKLRGTVDITLDAFCFYDINLSKRLQIDGVIEDIINIESISLNISNFTASINVSKRKTYKRIVSMQTHGE